MIAIFYLFRLLYGPCARSILVFQKFTRMEMLSSKKICNNCSSPIRGRTDKKFCDENCRNNFNNRLNAERNNLIRNINNTLGRNRRILAEFTGDDGKAVDVPVQKLLNRGYHLSFCTHKAKCKKGREFIF